MSLLQLFHVCQDIVLYQMGASMTQSLGYNLQLVYPVTSRSRPVLFMLPSQMILKQGDANVLIGKAKNYTGPWTNINQIHSQSVIFDRW